MSDSDLPRELPGGVREEDAALGVNTLEAVRARITRALEGSQGKWAAQPAWKRALPAILAALAGVGWLARGLMFGTLGASGAVAVVAAVVAFVAVVEAPRHPARAEWVARVALAAGCLALAAEIGMSWIAPPVDGPDMRCASAICVGAVVPLVLLALYLRSSRAPVRLFHVAALVGAGLLMSCAAVWMECPATKIEHVIGAHAVAPIVAGVVVALLLRPLLRGARA